MDAILLPAPKLTSPRDGSCPPSIRVEESIAPVRGPQSYRLSIRPLLIQIIGHDPAGVFYAKQTLRQLRSRFPAALPCVEIEDAPDFLARGIMLDVSRDKVPTIQTLFDLIDRLASWKINQLQLYIEHTFAYSSHQEVWKNASPLTAAEIRTLDAYCRERFIELVPNQNSFGHMERWLNHPAYLPLAEAPEGSHTPWETRWHGPFSLCPTDPGSIDLLRGLYDELLPNFTSTLFNVGCDETFDVGQGRSKAQCDAVGTTRVYVDFLKQVHQLVKERGRTMMFWGDIIRKSPELIAEVGGAIGLVWEYEAGSKFDADGELFQKAGVPFYVCPGTSSWCTIAGRTRNMLANAKAAAVDGYKRGAIGYLMTDWGDYGHLQYLPVSYAGFVAGAAFSWNSAAEVDLPRLLDLYAFEDDAGVMGNLAVAMGDVYQAGGRLIANASSLFRILVPPEKTTPAAGMTGEGLRASLAAIDAAMAPLEAHRMLRADAALIANEYENAAAMLRFACRLGEVQLDQSAISEVRLNALLEPIIIEHRRLWLARNRPGGLADSAKRLESLRR